MTDDASAAEELRRRVREAVGATFEVEDEIGRGGMAVVYRALDRRLRRRVALKVLPPDLAFRADVRSRFVREAQLAAQLAHPHIVPIYAVDETGGVVWFAMGLVEGETLAERLHREPRPDVAFVRRVLAEVAGALAYAHAQGVVHRDIKPDNVLVDRASGRALVTDFGIARAAEGDLKLTATGVAVGTPAYMSPEQAMGEKDVDGRADLYALGVMGWQMLAGELPFHSENTPGMLMKHISEVPRPLGMLRAGLPANLVYAIERAMAKGRADRWPDANAFREALAESAPAPSRAFSNAETPPGPTPAVLRSETARDPLRESARDRERGDHREQSDGGAPAGPSPNKPWRFDPMREASVQGEEGENAIREWRAQRQAWRDRYKPAPIEPEPLSRRERREMEREEERAVRRAAKTPEDRIRSVQRAFVMWVLWSAFLAAINVFTSPQFPWFVFPMLGMGIGVMSRVGSLWVDGIPLSRLFRRQPPAGSDPQAAPGSAAAAGGRAGARASARASVRTSGRAPSAAQLPAPDLSGVAADVLDGPHGRAVRDAAEARAVIDDVYGRLTAEERMSLPDVKGTANALDERVRALATALHQLDRDASPGALRGLEQRLADMRAAGGQGAEYERRIMLLERQHATLRDLIARREGVAGQLENAGILLHTMKLDLLKLRSTGLESAIEDSTLATQEAREVAQDIERVVDAANEARRL